MARLYNRNCLCPSLHIVRASTPAFSAPAWAMGKQSAKPAEHWKNKLRECQRDKTNLKRRVKQLERSVLHWKQKCTGFQEGFKQYKKAKKNMPPTQELPSVVQMGSYLTADAKGVVFKITWRVGRTWLQWERS